MHRCGGAHCDALITYFQAFPSDQDLTRNGLDIPKSMAEAPTDFTAAGPSTVHCLWILVTEDIVAFRPAHLG